MSGLFAHVMKILGVSAYFHDSSAALVVDGAIVAAAQEERFSRRKHDAGLPVGAMGYCLSEGRVPAEELDAIVFYENPLRKLDRTLAAAAAAGEPALAQFTDSMEKMLRSRLWMADRLRQHLGRLGRDDRLLHVEHHYAHAASAYYPSPFSRAAILTIDGVGEWATTTIGLGEESRVQLLREINYPHSLGLLYSAFTYYCGFRVNSGEYKLMGLAPYGRPRFADLIHERLIDLKPDGSYRLRTEYLGYLDSDVMTNGRFHELFGGPPREPESRLEQRHMDLAASIQVVLEDAVLRLCRHAREITGARDAVFAGGVALNCVANGVVLRERIFDHLWIQPAAGDAGGALGAALAVAHGYFGDARLPRPAGRDAQRASLLGPEYADADIARYLKHQGYPHREYATDAELHEAVAELLATGMIVGYVRGRMEFGPRALGARSILGDPRDPAMQARMNRKIKFRESFRPFAPAVLRECADEYFELETASPYMLLVAPVRTERRRPFDVHAVLAANDDDMLPAVNACRSDIPAVTHVDFSARVQTVDALEHSDLHGLLRCFEAKTGCPVCINTSFNVRGEPIVCTPEDAYRCFMRTDMDALVLGPFVLMKVGQPHFADDPDWEGTYGLD